VTRLSCLIIVVGYPLSDIEVAQPKVEYGIFDTVHCTSTTVLYCTVLVSIDPKINHSLSNRTS
jgi:hypothetical protein